MKALEIYVNGKQACLAVPKDNDGLYAQVEIWDDRESDRENSLAVWGRESNRVATWAYCQLSPGDEITIRVVDATESSAPVRYAPVLPEYER